MTVEQRRIARAQVLAQAWAQARAQAKAQAEAQALAADLAFLKAVYAGSPEFGPAAALDAFKLCTRSGMALPGWLARAARKELTRKIKRGTLKHYRRWREFRQMRDTRPGTLDTASKRFTPARKPRGRPRKVKSEGYPA